MAHRFRNGRWRGTTIPIIIFLFYFSLEYLVYFILDWNWEQLACPATSQCTRILFVADPQILGELDESNPVTIWDNDRYLRRTFSSAISFAKPDAVVFLGDLMDEGNRANDFEFQRYVNRFFNVFPSHSAIKTFYLPGDNDIGGENGDPILPSVVYRFRHIFHHKSELLVNSCHILKVNPVLEPIARPDHNQKANNKYIRIAVSHFPLLGMSTSFTQKMLNDFKPNLVFSAHSHLSRLRGSTLPSPSPLTVRMGPVSLGKINQSSESDYDNDWASVSDIHEIEVPTCSYRMGVSNMGYGYAVIDESRREFQYAVLWLPPRLTHLMLYLISAVVFGVFLLGWCYCRFRRSHHNYSLLNQQA